MSSQSQPRGDALSFIVGLFAFGLGFFIVTQNTVISSSFSLYSLVGFNPPFGLVILPLLIGVGMLFFNEKSIIGWLATVFGLLIIVFGILMGLTIQFRPVSLFTGILMFGMLAAGLGLMAKGLFGRA